MQSLIKVIKDVVQAFQAAGSRPPNRESVRQLLDPQYKPAAQPAAPKPQPVAHQAQKAVEAVAPKPPVKVQTQMDKNIAERAVRKQAEQLAYIKAQEAKKPKPVEKAKPITYADNSVKFDLKKGQANLSQKELDELMKRYQLR